MKHISVTAFTLVTTVITFGFGRSAKMERIELHLNQPCSTNLNDIEEIFRRSTVLIHRELNEATDGELDFYSYSGRAMYGARCVAINGDNLLDAVAKVAEAWQDSSQELGQLLRRARYDNMGRGMVLYFPEIEWDPEVSGSEEDEDADT